MKAVVLHADWVPRAGAVIAPEHEAQHWAVYANQVYRNPVARLEEREDPAGPGPREVILEVGACGICGSDVHMFETDEDGYMLLPYHLRAPVVTGHEFAGRIVAVGAEVKEFAVGDLVAAEEVQWCGECDSCRGGYLNQCRFVEDLGFTIDGGFAEFARVHAKYCWSLEGVLERYGDEKTALEIGAMTEPTSVAYEGIFTRSGGFSPGRSVAVFGAGPIGLASVALARAGGASNVIAFEVLPERREVAAKLGASHVFDPTQVDAAEAVAEITKGAGAAMAVETTGNFPAVIESIEQSLGVGGKAVIIGMDARRASLNFIDHQLRAATVYSSLGHSGSWDFPNVIGLMASGQIELEHAITRRFPLEQLVEAIDETKRRTDGKILVKPKL